MGDFFPKDDLCILNDKTYTYLHPATGSYSSLDLTLSSPEAAFDFTWKLRKTYVEVIIPDPSAGSWTFHSATSRTLEAS